MNIDHPSVMHIPQLRQLWKEAFGDSDEFLDLFFNKVFSPNRCLCATVGCEIVAAAYWFSCEEYAYIYAVATSKVHQGKGICHALMKEIHSLLAMQGYCGSILVPGDEGLRHFYSGMGYQNFGGIREFTCRAASPLPVRPIDGAEFEQLRRKYLPEGGVIQEGENTVFLSNTAAFFAGSDFLLTAVRDGDTLRGLELLGNAEAAPCILGALEIPCGTFRCPGNSNYAMWLPFGQRNPPTYFGFAFD